MKKTVIVMMMCVGMVHAMERDLEQGRQEISNLNSSNLNTGLVMPVMQHPYLAVVTSHSSQQNNNSPSNTPRCPFTVA